MPVIVASLIAVGVVVYFASIKDLIIFPSQEEYKFEFYTDEPNGGNSEVLEHFVSDSVLRFKYQLKDKFHSPYVGLGITSLNNKFINAEKYNQIVLSILGHNTDRIGFALYTPLLEFLKQDYQDETCYHSYLNITREAKTYRIPTAKLYPPEWWQDIHHLSANEKVPLDLSKILHITIGSAYSPNIEKEKMLEIYYIAFSRDNHKLLLITGLIFIGFIILNIAIGYFFSFKKNKSSKIIIAYKSLDIIEDASNEEKCIEFINSNYNISNLTLKRISEETAITQRRITKIIKDRFNCNFKTYLNQIRINESKRFLTQSNLNIGEIAYKVGFNSQSHFNRVFKSEIQISPTDYRGTHNT
jgi:AraC-like DNA-binding protein